MKQETLEGALTLLDLNLWTYLEATHHYHPNQINSAELTKAAIRWFMLGRGRHLPSEGILSNKYNFKSKTNTERNF